MFMKKAGSAGTQPALIQVHNSHKGIDKKLVRILFFNKPKPTKLCF